MKNIKKILVALLCVATVLSSLALTSCGLFGCKHEWGDWKTEIAATCTKKGAESRTCTKCGKVEASTVDATPHSFGEWERVAGTECESGAQKRTCSACGFSESKNEGETHSANVICDYCGKRLVDLEKIFALNPISGINNLAVIANDVSISSDNGDIAIDLAEVVLYINSDGMPEGYGYGELKILNKAVNISRATKAAFYLEDGKAYVAAIGFGDTNTTEEDDFYVQLDFDAVISSAGISEAIGALEEVESKLPEIESWYNNTFLPIFENLDFAIEVDNEKLTNVAYSIANAFFATKKTENGTELVLSADALKAANAALADTKVAKLVDNVVGEGTFDALKQFVPEALDFTVGDLLAAIDEAGVNVDEFFASLDALAVVLTGDNTATLESMLGITDEDISELIKGDDVKSLALRDAVVSMLGLEDDAETPENEAYKALDDKIDEIFELLETKSLYEIFGDAKQAEENINETIDTLLKNISLSIRTDADGKMNCAVVEVKNLGVLDATVEFKSNGISVHIESDDGLYQINGALIANYDPAYDKANLPITLDQIKSAFAVAKLNEKVALNVSTSVYSSEVEGYYVDGALAGITVKSADEYRLYTEDGISYYIIREICEYVILFTDAPMVTTVVDYGCNNKVAVVCNYATQRTKTIEKTLYSENDEVLETLPAETETVNYNLTVRFNVDKLTGEYAESAEHDWVYDEVNSVINKCEEHSILKYTCSACSATRTDYNIKRHNFSFYPTVTATELIYPCTYEDCETVRKLSVSVGDGITFKSAEDKYSGYTTSYTFTASETAKYTVAVTSDNDSSFYINLFSSDGYVYAEDNSYDLTDGVVTKSYSYELEAGKTYTIRLEVSSAGDADGTLSISAKKN